MIRHGRTRRRRWLAVLAAALVAGTAAAQSGETPSGGTPPPGGRPGGGADVDAALAFLAKQQSRDGSFGRANQLALTGMAGLAFLAAGSTPKRGPHAERIAKACEFILACQADGRAFTHPSSGYSAIHNHGYALLLLTQCLGEAGTLDKRLRPAIGAAVQASANSQEKNGGFTYFLYGKQPPEHRDMWSWDEASTTISQIQALRGAREAGFAVASRVLDRAGKYLARSQHKETGGFPYSIGGGVPRISVEEGSNKPTFAVTAATAAVLQALGTYEGDALDRAIAYMETFEPGRT